MDADADDFKVAPKTKRKSYEIDYRSLTQSEVEKQMQEEVDYICNILGVEVGPFSTFFITGFHFFFMESSIGKHSLLAAAPHVLE